MSQPRLFPRLHRLGVGIKRHFLWRKLRQWREEGFEGPGLVHTCEGPGDMIFLPLPRLVVFIRWPLILQGQPTLARSRSIFRLCILLLIRSIVKLDSSAWPFWVEETLVTLPFHAGPCPCTRPCALTTRARLGIIGLHVPIIQSWQLRLGVKRIRVFSVCFGLLGEAPASSDGLSCYTVLSACPCWAFSHFSELGWAGSPQDPPVPGSPVHRPPHSALQVGSGNSNPVPRTLWCCSNTLNP